MQVCFLTTHTHAVLHSLKIGPFSFRATHLVFLCMRVCIKMEHFCSISHLNLLTGFPMSSGHCSSPLAILSHFLNRS